VRLRNILLGLLAILLFSSLTACIPTAVYSSSTLDNPLPSIQPIDNQDEKNNLPANVKTNGSVNDPGAALAGVVSFDGTVFVASTQMVVDAWYASGWKISDQPLDTDLGPAPIDCTLYPHVGVSNQWVGGCAGHVQIPRFGAENIAVIFTNQDGVTEMIQVAP
jgi:hypothetical protein